MKCEHCKQKEATCFYQINTGGTLHSYSLCEDCAAKMQFEGLGFSSPFEDMSHLFGGLFGAVKPTQKADKTCPACGARWRDIAAKGKVFCAKCYEAFGEELAPTLRSLHGGATHTGRAPARERAMREKDTRLASLRAELTKAIAEENFELAATLRDEIRALEKK